MTFLTSVSLLSHWWQPPYVMAFMASQEVVLPTTSIIRSSHPLNCISWLPSHNSEGKKIKQQFNLFIHAFFSLTAYLWEKKVEHSYGWWIWWAKLSSSNSDIKSSSNLSEGHFANTCLSLYFTSGNQLSGNQKHYKNVICSDVGLYINGWIMVVLFMGHSMFFHCYSLVPLQKTVFRKQKFSKWHASQT